MTSNWKKFKLLLWKNFLIQRRHKVETFFEVVLPIVFACQLLVLRAMIRPEYHSDIKRYDALPTNTLFVLRNNSERFNPRIEWEIAFTPHTDFIEALLTNAVTHLNASSYLALVPYDNSTVLEEALRTRNSLCAVEFPSNYSNLPRLPENVHFSVRFPAELRTKPYSSPVELGNWFTNLKFPSLQEYGPRNGNDTDGGIPPGYWREGFIPIQAAISAAVVDHWNVGRHNVTPVFLQRFPFSGYVEDNLLKTLELILPLIILISLLCSVVNITKQVSTERENQLKEVMKIMGLPNWLHWSAWFVKSLLTLSLTVTLLTILLKLPIADEGSSILTRTHWSTLWLFLFSFCIPSITFCFLVSVFFRQANVAALSSGLIWLIAYTPFAVTAVSYGDLQMTSKFLVCSASNSALAVGLQLIIKFEGLGTGLQWTNLASSHSIDDRLTVLHVMGMFIVDAVFYMLLALYFERIIPGSSGVSDPWYFPVLYFVRRKPFRRLSSIEISSFEQNSHMNRVGIMIKSLRKVYDTGKVAVRGLNMSLYEDQITVLLGHNGAGKSTTMSILTGLIQPSAGTAIVNGFDILEDIEGVRRSFGLCPQHNILFDDLTVSEHLQFYTALKGLDYIEAEVETLRYIQKLQLDSKTHAVSKTLSGGQKRKLSVALALCGRNKIVLLDEPTAGMDPSARRGMWDLLIEEKEGRTILLSTHYMDEADVLGDRIAILADGELEAIGSSFYLKKKFGAGYRLICVKRSGCESRLVTEQLQRHIPDLRINTEVGAELSYILDEGYTDRFQKLFEDLEYNLERLNVASFGVSLTTLEEVFMKVGSDSNEITILERPHGSQIIDAFDNTQSSTAALDDEKIVHLTGRRLLLSQIKAMFVKKFAYTRHNPILFLVSNVIPVLFVIIAMLATNSLQNKKDLPELPITFHEYDQTVTLFEASNWLLLRPEVKNLFREFNRTVSEGGSSHKTELIPTPFADEILSLSEKKFAKVSTEYLIGASVQVFGFSPYLVSWFNNKAYHTAPLSLNTLYNAVLRQFCESCSISVSNKPLPYKRQSKQNVLYQGNSFGYQLAYNSGFALAFVAGCFSLFYFKERATKSKLLQLVSGVNLAVYWAVSFVWDFLSFLLVIFFYLATIAWAQQNTWSSWEELINVGVILVCFVWSVLPTIYVGSFLCNSPTAGFVRITLYFLLTGNTLFFLVSIFSLPFVNLGHYNTMLGSYFMVFPQFAVPNSINAMDWIITPKQVCADECDKIPGCNSANMCSHIEECCTFTNHYDYFWPGVGENLTYMVTSGFAAWLILILIETRTFQRLRNLWRRRHLPLLKEELKMDSDVRDEKLRTIRIKDTELSKWNLVIKNLSKFYGDFAAVKDLSVAVDASECFGLLGLNGAGKTTTFKMLTGDLSIDFGNAWVQGLSLKRSMSEVYQRIGYCPQFDAVLQDLTGFETLKMYCLIHGVPSRLIPRVVERLAFDLNFQKHLHKQVKHYSGGNKRKLSAAVALAGNPAVVYLDEPTAGMDVAARRLLWNLICRTREEGKSIVLTSHSMEECEALCTKLAIMVNGEFMCMGSPQLLKGKFSNGFTLKIKLKRESVIEGLDVRHFVPQHFNGAVLREQHLDLLTYQIPATNMRWSEMFGVMEKAKQRLNIEDYSLGQTSLEQVFLFFTRYQALPRDVTVR